MKARQLILDARLPANLEADVLRAFENAWLEVKDTVGPQTAPVRARLKLVGILLLLMHVIKNDPDRLKAAAVRVFNGEHKKGGD